MHSLESFRRSVPPVEEIAKIHQDINRAENFAEERGPDTFCKRIDCS